MGKTIIILRHAEDLFGCLTARGIKQAQDMGQKIKALYPEAIFEVWTCPTRRAAETTKIISDLIATSDIFTSDAFHSTGEMSRQLAIINSSKSEYLLVITYADMCRNMSKEYGKSQEMITYGNGLLVNQDGSHFEYFKTEN